MILMVIGKPIGHSLSPLIHNYWIRKYNLNYKYLKKEIEKKDLRSIIEQVRNKKVKGINITLPYKNEVFKLVDYVTPFALKSNAVNTIYLKNNKVYGDNTDGKGFINSLEEEAKTKVKGKNIFLIGAGGAAQGILAELINCKVKKVRILNRTKINAEKLIKKFEKDEVDLSLDDWEKAKPKGDTDIVINTSSYGMKKSEYLELNTGNLTKKVIMYDIIYKPAETRLMKAFKMKGFFSFNGLGMLIHQAALSFFLWFNIKLTNEDLSEARKLCEKSF
ncbi:MAG: shikimate dehydrogenase [Rickettsiales bacterium]|nr:shikimate dehydrogenase [Rickettsiales bacterium]|tara:strand:+ start:886 stop:1713 length:828 start_codon:yes stop_codon:yes gene_type:complete